MCVFGSNLKNRGEWRKSNFRHSILYFIPYRNFAPKRPSLYQKFYGLKIATDICVAINNQTYKR